MKRCFKCNKIKSLSEFQKDRSKKDGLQIYCKSCRKEYQQSLQGKATSRKGNKKYYKTEKYKTADKRSKTRHLNQVKARNAVKYAIESGKIPRPDTLFCRYCPKPAQQYHHWHGYEKEHLLDVVSICTDCHSKTRRRVG